MTFLTCTGRLGDPADEGIHLAVAEERTVDSQLLRGGDGPVAACWRDELRSTEPWTGLRDVGERLPRRGGGGGRGLRVMDALELIREFVHLAEESGWGVDLADGGGGAFPFVDSGERQRTSSGAVASVLGTSHRDSATDLCVSRR